MATDLKVELRRLVDQLERAYQVAEDGDHPDRLQWYDDWRAASWALQRLEELEADLQIVTLMKDDAVTSLGEFRKYDNDYDLWAQLVRERDKLEARCESLTSQNDDLLTKSAEWAKEVKRLRQVIAGEIAAQAQERGEYDDPDPHYTSEIDPERYM